MDNLYMKKDFENIVVQLDSQEANSNTKNLEQLLQDNMVGNHRYK